MNRSLIVHQLTVDDRLGRLEVAGISVSQPEQSLGAGVRVVFVSEAKSLDDIVAHADSPPFPLAWILPCSSAVNTSIFAGRLSHGIPFL